VLCLIKMYEIVLGRASERQKGWKGVRGTRQVEKHKWLNSH
jgi:hypothetical protein